MHKGWSTCTLAIVLVVVAPRGARADGPAVAGAACGKDEVTLKSGAAERGLVVAVEPGVRVVLILQRTRETRTLRWAEVERVARDKYPSCNAEPPAPAAAPVVAPPVLPPAPLAPGTVRIHIATSDPRVQLLTWLGPDNWKTSADWTRNFVCGPPCDTVVDNRGDRHFILTGEGLNETRSFYLSAWTGDIAIRVSPGSAQQHTLSKWMIGIGLAAATVGALGAGVVFAPSSSTPQPGDPPNLIIQEPGPSAAAKAGVLTALIGGGALAMSGIVLFATSITKYKIHESRPAAPALLPRARSQGLVWQF